MSHLRKKFLACSTLLPPGTGTILVLLVLWLAGQTVISVAQFLNGRQSHQRADAWLQEAQVDAKPDMTPDDAARWLKASGVRPFTTLVNGQKSKSHIIGGWRVLERKSIWTEPLTAELIFHFDSNGRFTRVELKCDRFEIDPE
jgi:hypothetical protein